MFNIFKTGLVPLFTFCLATCVHAQDVNHSKPLGTEQNKFQQGQLNQAQEIKQSISLVGVVANLSNSKSVINATVRIKIAGNFSTPVTITSGAFQIDNVPADADYELVVQSASNAFIDKTFFGKTRASNSMTEVYQDLGVLAVAENGKDLNALLFLPNENQLLASSH